MQQGKADGFGREHGHMDQRVLSRVFWQCRGADGKAGAEGEQQGAVERWDVQGVFQQVEHKPAGLLHQRLQQSNLLQGEQRVTEAAEERGQKVGGRDLQQGVLLPQLGALVQEGGAEAVGKKAEAEEDQEVRVGLAGVVHEPEQRLRVGGVGQRRQRCRVGHRGGPPGFGIEGGRDEEELLGVHVQQPVEGKAGEGLDQEEVGVGAGEPLQEVHGGAQPLDIGGGLVLVLVGARGGDKDLDEERLQQLVEGEAHGGYHPLAGVVLHERVVVAETVQRGQRRGTEGQAEGGMAVRDFPQIGEATEREHAIPGGSREKLGGEEGGEGRGSRGRQRSENVDDVLVDERVGRLEELPAGGDDAEQRGVRLNC